MKLATLRRSRSYARRDEQPIRLKLDSGIAVELPGPRVLAEAYALPRLRDSVDVFRAGQALLARPTGTSEAPTPANQLQLAADLGDALAALPRRDDAGDFYRHLGYFMTEATPGRIQSYLRDVISALRILVPVWRPPAASQVRHRPMTPTERKRAQRSRDRHAEILSARWWVLAALEDTDGYSPGTRIVAADLYAQACAALSDLADDEEPIDDDDPDSPTVSVPGRGVFYAVADEILGPRRRGNHGAHTYVIPDTPQDDNAH
jgi:hypothetical protein